jgi:glycosyltransferase involved in cell wall biosynthesis
MVLQGGHRGRPQEIYKMAHNEEFSGSKRLKGVPMISIVIPLYNEEENIQELCRRLIDVLDSIRESYEVLFVDDGSTDGSYARLLEIKKNNESIKIVKFRRNFGQTAAIHAGFDYAQGEIIATLDADLQNDPQDIPDMVKKLNYLDMDVVCGWRYQRQDKFHKKILSRFANGLRRKLTGESFTTRVAHCAYTGRRASGTWTLWRDASLHSRSSHLAGIQGGEQRWFIMRGIAARPSTMEAADQRIF